MGNEFFYANGFSLANVRKLCKFYFGDFFIKAVKNNKNLRFDIYITNKINNLDNEILSLEDYADLDYFNKFWNNGNENNPIFNIMVGNFS